MKSDVLDLPLNLLEDPYCGLNETYWVEALLEKDLDRVYFPTIQYKQVTFQIDPRTKVVVMVPFKIQAGVESGLVYINGILKIITIRNNKLEIYRRSALSKGIEDQINSKFRIPHIQMQEEFEEEIEESDWDLYFDGRASISNRFLQYKSTLAFLILSDVPLETKNNLVPQWILSLDPLIINDAFIRSIIYYARHLPTIIDSIIEKIAHNNLPITQESFLEITKNFCYSQHSAKELLEIITNLNFQNPQIITKFSFEHITRAIITKQEYPLILQILKDDFVLNNYIDSYFIRSLRRFILEMEDPIEDCCKILDLLLETGVSRINEELAYTLVKIISDDSLRLSYLKLIQTKFKRANQEP